MKAVGGVNVRWVQPEIISPQGLIGGGNLTVPSPEVEKQSNEQDKNRGNERNRDNNGEDMAVEVLGRSGLREEKSGNVGRKSRKRRGGRRGRRRRSGIGGKEGFGGGGVGNGGKRKLRLLLRLRLRLRGKGRRRRQSRRKRRSPWEEGLVEEVAVVEAPVSGGGKGGEKEEKEGGKEAYGGHCGEEEEGRH